MKIEYILSMLTRKQFDNPPKLIKPEIILVNSGPVMCILAKSPQGKLTAAVDFSWKLSDALLFLQYC